MLLLIRSRFYAAFFRRPIRFLFRGFVRMRTDGFRFRTALRFRPCLCVFVRLRLFRIRLCVPVRCRP